MSLNFKYAVNNASLAQVLAALKESIVYNLNCIKIATVTEFDKTTYTAKCQIMNKRLIGLNADGTQQLQDYPPIYARVHNIGWGGVGITHPIAPGMEGFLLFNDRELETWFKTGTNGVLAYNRCHDLTDAIFICGLHSEPNIQLVQYLENAIHIFYNLCGIKISETNITIDGNTVINGDTTATGSITGTSLVDSSAATGSFTSSDGKTVTVQNGIIKSIS